MSCPKNPGVCVDLTVAPAIHEVNLARKTVEGARTDDSERVGITAARARAFARATFPGGEAGRERTVRSAPPVGRGAEPPSECPSRSRPAALASAGQRAS